MKTIELPLNEFRRKFHRLLSTNETAWKLGANDTDPLKDFPTAWKLFKTLPDACIYLDNVGDVKHVMVQVCGEEFEEEVLTTSYPDECTSICVAWYCWETKTAVVLTTEI